MTEVHQTPETSTRVRAEAENVTETARAATADVKDTASEAARQTVDEVKYNAQSTYEEARYQARHLMNEGRAQLSAQAGTQQSRLADALHGLAGELDSMATGTSEQGMATDLARRAAGIVHDAGGWLDSRAPEDVLDEITTFARRRPVAFLAVAAGLGFVIGRVARSMKDEQSSGQVGALPSGRRRADAYVAPYEYGGSGSRYATTGSQYGTVQGGYGTPRGSGLVGEPRPELP